MAAVAIPSQSTLETAYEDEVRSRQANLDDWREGSALDALRGGEVLLWHELIRVGLKRWESGLIALAQGSDLDVLIASFGGASAPTRNAAAAATASVTLTRVTAVGGHTVAADTVVYGEAADGTRVEFTTDDETVIGSGDNVVQLDITASATGPGGNVAAATLVNVTGLPTGWTVTQPVRASGGADEETDDALRQRFWLYLAALAGAGTPEALRSGALSVSGVAYASVDESNIGTGTGYVAVYIADSEGGVPSDPGDVADLIEDVELVYASDTNRYRAAGVEVRVLAGEREDHDYTIAIVARKGSSITESKVIAATVALHDLLSPGESLYLSLLETALHDIDRDNVLSADASDDAAPSSRVIAPASGAAALRTDDAGADLTITITFV